MEIVLGVSMTPTAVRMVLVEGDGGDGVTVDSDRVDLDSGADPNACVEHVVAAILGTRESAAEGGHRLVLTGVSWSSHTAAAALRAALRAHAIDDATLISELHAAAALAQAAGRATGCDRVALVMIDGDIAELAVVRTADGAVVRVEERYISGTGSPADAADMVVALEGMDVPPQAVFVTGPAAAVAAVRDVIAARTALPVHAPDEPELALARGAALAAAGTPRYEASTVGLAPLEDTQAAPALTQMAAAGYMAPLGYSAVADDPLDEGAGADADDETSAAPAAEAEPAPFLLVGSAMATLFVVGVAALVVSLAVTIRPSADQRPDPGQSAVPASTLPAADVGRPPAPAPQTIPAPVPVVQEAPRAIVPTPIPALNPAPAPAVVPAPVVAAPAPAAPPAAPPAPVPAAPAPVPVPVPAAPAPVLPPIVIAPMFPPLLPPSLRTPVRSTPVPTMPTITVTPTPVAPSTVTETPTTVTMPPSTVTQYPTATQYPTTSAVPSSAQSAPAAPSTSAPAYTLPTEAPSTAAPSITAPTTTVWPLWPMSG